MFEEGFQQEYLDFVGGEQKEVCQVEVEFMEVLQHQNYLCQIILDQFQGCYLGAQRVMLGLCQLLYLLVFEVQQMFPCAQNH